MIQSLKRRSAFTLIVSIFVASLSGPITTGQPREAAIATQKRSVASIARPRLVLLVVADQFRYDYLERFGDLFGTNGLRRVMRDGASWIDANCDHVPTYTAPGHSTMMTRAYPALTGIIANDWPDRILVEAISKKQ